MRLLARGALAAESTAERPLKAGATSRPEVVTAEMASMLCAEMDRAAKVMSAREEEAADAVTDEKSARGYESKR